MKIVFCAPDKDPQPWLDSFAAHFAAYAAANSASSHSAAELWSWCPGESPDAAQVPRSCQAEYAIVWAPTAEFFASQTNLKAIFAIGAGVDGAMRLPNLPDGVPIVRLNDAGMGVQMAEYVCHALIRHTREFDRYETQAKKVIWNVRKPIDRAAWPVGIMGLGSIGARVAKSVAAFDYPTYGWSRSEKQIDGITTFAGADSLGLFLQSVRVLVCVLPLTPDTENILNFKTLSQLKPGGYLINVARGKHLVESDLLKLIDSGAMAGATLDVFQTEPLPANHVLWQHPKITITPHCSAITLREQSVAQIVDKIHALQAGQRVDGVVNLGSGY